MRTKSTMAALAIITAFGAMTAQSIAQHQEAHAPHDSVLRRPLLSPEDRAAFLDARLAALHIALRLTVEQEKLWPPLETAARDKAKTMMDLWEKNRHAGRPVNLIEGLKRRGEADTAKGQADAKLADAAQPLWNTLTEQQKHRFERLARVLTGDERQGRPGEDRRGLRSDEDPSKRQNAGRPLEDFAPPTPARPSSPPR